MIWCTFLSILVPLFIAGSLRNEIGKVSKLKYLLDYLTAFIHPVHLHCQVVVAKYVRKKLPDQNDYRYASKFALITKEIRTKEEELAGHSQLLLGLETIYQLMGTSLLLCYALSKTKTRQGLVAFFDQEDLEFYGIYFSAKLVVGFLIALSFMSFIKSQLNGIIQGYAFNYEPMGKIMILLFLLINCMIRISTVVLYFSPSLGLFDLLHHYQGKSFQHIKI